MKPIPVSGGQPPIGSQPTFKSKGSCLEFVGQNMSHEHEPPGNKNILTFEKRLSSSSSVKQPSPPSISLDPQPHLHPPPPASKTSQMDAKVPMWPPTSRCSSAWNRGISLPLFLPRGLPAENMEGGDSFNRGTSLLCKGKAKIWEVLSS